MVETNIKNLVINKMTKAQYDALEVKDPNQLYYIVDDEMYVDVARLAVEVDAGKQLIAQAITDKGVPASADESLSELAEKVSEIDWNPNVGFTFIDGGPKTLVEWFISSKNYLTEIDDYNITDATIFARAMYAFANCPVLTSIKLHNISGTMDANMGFALFTQNLSLRYVELPKITQINISAVFESVGNIQDIELIVPNCIDVAFGFNRYNHTTWKSLEFGKLRTFSSSSASTGGQYNLRNITVGNGTDINLPFQYIWDARNVIAEGQSGIDELNSNIQNNLIDNLYDYSGGTAHTITLSAGLKAVLTQETINMANNKGWNIL